MGNDQKQKCPKCDKPEVSGRRVRGEWNLICSNGHNWPKERPVENKTPEHFGIPFLGGFVQKNTKR